MKKLIKIYLHIFMLYVYIYKSGFNCKKCKKATNINLKYGIHEINKLHFKFIDCWFEIIVGIDESF